MKIIVVDLYQYRTTRTSSAPNAPDIDFRFNRPHFQV